MNSRGDGGAGGKSPIPADDAGDTGDVGDAGDAGAQPAAGGGRASAGAGGDGVAAGSTGSDGGTSGSGNEAAAGSTSVPLTEVFVDPLGGHDESEGSRDAPFKSIARAGVVASAAGAKTIWLLDGTYGAASEPRFAGKGSTACGADGSGVLLPEDVELRADHAGMARLRISGGHGLCARGGTLSGLVLERVAPGGKLLEAASGALTVSGTQFANCGLPGAPSAVTSADSIEACVVATASASVTLEAEADVAWVTEMIGTFVAARNEAIVKVTGGRLSVAPSSQTQPLFVVAESSHLTLAHLDASSTAGGVATQVHAAGSLSIESADLTGFDVACRASTADAQVLIDDVDLVSTRFGLFIDTTSPARGSFILRDARVSGANSVVLVQSGNVELSITDSNFSQNQNGVLFNGYGEVTLQNSRISENAIALRFMPNGGALALRLRGVQVTNNTQVGVLVAGQPAGAVDFGTAASPGNNVFTGNAGAAVAGANLVLGGGYPVSVAAVGNTWDSSVQGANSAGRYEATGDGAKLEVSAGLGPNYRILAALTTLRLAENP